MMVILGGHYVGPKSWNFFTCQYYGRLGSGGHPSVPFSEMVDFMSKSKNQNSSPMYVVNRSEKVDIDFSHNICCFCNDLPLKLENLGAHALIE